MSSRSLSGVADLLRVTVALPVSVATFPIGSSLAAWSDGLAAVAGEVGGAGCACADMVRSGTACAAAAPGADGVAKTFAGPIKQQTSQTARINRRRVTRIILGKTGIGEGRYAIEDSTG